MAFRVQEMSFVSATTPSTSGMAVVGLLQSRQ